MKALILVGGYGTRLRPLTLSVIKPLIPLANKPIMVHQVEALARAGVNEIVVAGNPQFEEVIAELSPVAASLGVSMVFSREDCPMGTGGPIGLAAEFLSGDEPFIVLNGDVVCSFPFQQMIEFHMSHGKEGTILVTRVSDPSKYGVVIHHDRIVKGFVEKPSSFLSDEINAGVYVFSTSFLDRVGPWPCSIEREVFPQMAKNQELCCYPLDGFWADVGNPGDYLKGTSLLLESCERRFCVDPTAYVDPSCKMMGFAVVGPGCTVSRGTRLERSVLLPNSKVCDSSLVKDSVIGWDSVVGSWNRITDTTVLGQDVKTAECVSLKGAVVLPHKTITEDCTEPGKIFM